MNNYGWICPQCGRVWGPMITKCEPCGEIACMASGRARTEVFTDKCDAYHDGECWGTKEREATNCEGNASKCDKYHSDWR